MESPPTAIEHTLTSGGVASMPTTGAFRSLMAASQGPRPLSNVFAYRTTRMGRPIPMSLSDARFHVGGMVQNQGFERSRTTYSMMSMPNEDATGEPKEDERKPPAESDPAESLSNAHDDTARLTDRRSIESDPETASQVPRLFAFQPAPPPNRCLRKRKGEAESTASKRSAMASAPDGKPSANLKIDPDECSDAGSCCICMGDPEEGENASIDSCDHALCFECIEKWSERENTCPLCKVRFSRITRVDKTKRKKGQKGTKKVKQRDQRADMNPGHALQGLLGTTNVFRPDRPYRFQHLPASQPTAGLHQNSGFSSSIARLLFSGLGPSAGGGVIDFGTNTLGGPPPVMARRSGGPRQVRFRNPVAHIDDTFFSDNDDGSDDDPTGFADFLSNMRQMNQQGGTRVEQHQFTVFGTYPMLSGESQLGGRAVGRATDFDAMTAQLTRSYATNAHVANAGGTADNALEIESDSDEDEVEVVDVRSGA